MTVTALPRVPYTGTASEAELERWRAVARQVAGTLAADALARDRANKQPFAEVQLLREAGLLELLVPAEFGGAGGHFETAFEVIRILAAADGSISQLLAYHYINQSGIAFYAPAEAQADWWRRTVAGSWLWGDSVNPVDPNLVLTREGDGYRLNGAKRFSTGSGVGEVIVVNAQVEGSGELLAFVVPREAEGLRIVDDWDYLGQRLSASNSLEYRNVRIEPSDVLGPVTDEPVATLLTPGIQLAFANFYLGIAEGALARGRQILLGRTNAWFLSQAETYSQDVVFQRTVGGAEGPHRRGRRAGGEAGPQVRCAALDGRCGHPAAARGAGGGDRGAEGRVHRGRRGRRQPHLRGHRILLHQERRRA